MRIYCISDLYIEHPYNLKLLRNITKHHNDIILVAGNVGKSLKSIKKALMLLKTKFKYFSKMRAFQVYIKCIPLLPNKIN